MRYDTEKELEEMREIRADSKNIYDGVVLHVRRDDVLLKGGHMSVREVIRHIGAVCVIPVTDDNEVIVERQFRYPFDEVITEIPAGKLDADNEDRLSAAKRELVEETGITADNWTELGLFYPAAAYSDECITMYMARGLHYGKQRLDEDEFLQVHRIPLAELVEDVMQGRIPDSKTQTAILKAARILGV